MITQSQKVKWLEDLRSGRYTQGKSMLHRNGKYCCLGVLAIGVGKTVCEIDRLGLLVDVGLSSLLGPPQRTKAVTEIEEKLADMNDRGMGGGNGATFPEIADWIEANVPVEPDEGVLVKREALTDSAGVKEP